MKLIEPHNYMYYSPIMKLYICIFNAQKGKNIDFIHSNSSFFESYYKNKNYSMSSTVLLSKNLHNKFSTNKSIVITLPFCNITENYTIDNRVEDYYT